MSLASFSLRSQNTSLVLRRHFHMWALLRLWGSEYNFLGTGFSSDVKISMVIRMNNDRYSVFLISEIKPIHPNIYQ